MFEANEGDSASVYDQLARVGGPDADHEHDVDIRIEVEQVVAAAFSLARQRDHVDPLDHRAEIDARRVYGGFDDLVEVRTGRIDYVIVPVRLENRSVGFEVAEIRGGGISTVVNC